MSRLHITHTTVYRYSQPVKFGLHRLVVRPREGHDLQVEDLRLRIQPQCQVTWHRDLFNNSIAVANFSDPSDYLEFCSEVTILRRDIVSHRGLLDLLPVSFPVVYSPLELPVIQGYLDPVFRLDMPSMQAWLAEAFPAIETRDAVTAMAEIGTWIYKNIKYRRREDRGVQSPEETLSLHSGSCRDMATLLLEAVRALKLAARFASGYLHTLSSEAGRASTHAWTEVYFPDHGWFGFDPTVGEMTSAKHIVTGVSAHPRGVMPISGTFSGEMNLYLGMEVSVKIESLKGLSESPTEGSSI
ncbi:transglutaminase family protein [soil metagenome]